MQAVDIGGKKYIKASDAAKAVGYTTDYVGQLARAGKIDATQIGRAWYIRENEITEHKKNNVRSNKEKTREAVKEILASPEVHEIHNVLYTPPDREISEFRKRLLDTAVRYEHDKEPLAPLIQKEKEVAAVPYTESEGKMLEVEDLDDKKELPHVLSVTESPRIILSLEKPVEPQMHGMVSITEPDESVEKLGEVDLAPADSAQKIKKPEMVVLPSKKTHKKHHSVHHLVPVTPVVSGTAKVPFIALPKKQRSGLVAVGAVLPLLLFILFAVSFSGIFLQKVLVYQQGDSQKAQPYYQAYYALTEVHVFKSLISR